MSEETPIADYTTMDDVPNVDNAPVTTKAVKSQGVQIQSQSLSNSPGWIKQLRQFKLGEFVLFDTILSFVAAYFLRQYVVPNFFVSDTQLYYSVIPLSLVAHFLVGQRTSLGDKVLYAPTLNVYHALVAFCIMGMIYESHKMSL